MKNFKKIIFLGVALTGVIIYTIFKMLLNSNYEEIEYQNLYDIQTFEETKEEEEKHFIILHITGEIANPGIIKLEEGSRVSDAIEEAGGLTQNANVDKVNLAYVLQDGQKLYIPSIYDIEEEEYLTNDAGKNVIEEEFTLKQNEKININTATRTRIRNINRNRSINSIKNNKL